MSEGLLTILKFCFLALVYLFLLRVVRVVMLELKASKVPVPAADFAAPEAMGMAAPAAAHAKRKRGTPSMVIVEPAPRAGETFPLDDEITVGRAAGCAVVLAEDTFASQVHARVFRRGGETYVEDLGSTNGTYVNGERVGEATRVQRGDRVQFGRTVAEISK